MLARDAYYHVHNVLYRSVVGEVEGVSVVAYAVHTIVERVWIFALKYGEYLCQRLLLKHHLASLPCRNVGYIGCHHLILMGVTIVCHHLSGLQYHAVVHIVAVYLDTTFYEGRLHLAVVGISRIEGMSNADIAGQLQLSVRTVEHQIYLALKELKRTMLLFVLLVGI